MYANRMSLNGDIKQYYKGKGCKKCYNSGYSGRKGIYEVLVPDGKTRELILDRRSAEEVRSAAQHNGMKTLRQIAIENLKNGETTIEEILRITQETEDE
jgi:type II secretory ATPase GspE/PulE/Tfp pilus assembly ATPase PilB-like protein